MKNNNNYANVLQYVKIYGEENANTNFIYNIDTQQTLQTKVNTL